MSLLFTFLFLSVVNITVPSNILLNNWHTWLSNEIFEIFKSSSLWNIYKMYIKAYTNQLHEMPNKKSMTLTIGDLQMTRKWENFWKPMIGLWWTLAQALWKILYLSLRTFMKPLNSKTWWEWKKRCSPSSRKNTTGIRNHSVLVCSY